MLPYIAEFLGTMILIILGDGVVANVNLNKSGMKGAGAVQITYAWGLAVLLPAFIFGEASGASFNPALTIALAVNHCHGISCRCCYHIDLFMYFLKCFFKNNHCKYTGSC